MKKFEMSRYIKKWLPFIIVACIAITCASYFVLNKKQHYDASAVIHYKNSNMVSGLAPNGQKFDSNEIKSSAVLTAAINELNLDTQDYSVDSLSSRIIIYDVLDTDDAELKSSKIEKGEEFETYPDTFIVTFSATSGEGKDFARAFLDKVLSCYFTEYGKKYLNTSPLTNNLTNIAPEVYDYIEVLDIIDDSVSKAMDSLYSKSASNKEFRSTETGYSFNDLATKFSFARDVKLASLYSLVLDNQLTKDKALLEANYAEKIKQNEILVKGYTDKSSDVIDIINEYVQKMHDSGNTNITYEYILEEVYNWYEAGSTAPSDSTVTYDKLIFLWSDYTAEERKTIIQSAYYKYIQDAICGCRGDCTNGQCLRSNKTCEQFANSNYDALCTEVSKKIDALINELVGLYNYAQTANSEYNDYLGASSIATLSSVTVQEGMNLTLYMVLICVVVLIIGCGGAILVGRISDIVVYMFYTDRLTELGNRSGVDDYINKLSYKVLDNGNQCAVLTIINLKDINMSLSRTGGDEMIKYVAATLKETFANNTDSYLAYNGSAQYVVFSSNSDYDTTEYMMKNVCTALENYMKEKRTSVKYSLGISDTTKNNVRNVRGLFTKAMAEAKPHEMIVEDNEEK